MYRNKINRSHVDRIGSIRSILLSDWDPIGIGDNPNLSDEYDRYINAILHLLLNNTNVEDIANTLTRIERNEMSIIKPNSSNSYKVAQKLKNLKFNTC